MTDAPPPVNDQPSRWVLNPDFGLVPVQFNSSDNPPDNSSDTAGGNGQSQIIARMQAAEEEVTSRSDGTPALKKRRSTQGQQGPQVSPSQ